MQQTIEWNETSWEKRAATLRQITESFKELHVSFKRGKPELSFREMAFIFDVPIIYTKKEPKLQCRKNHRPVFWLNMDRNPGWQFCVMTSYRIIYKDSININKMVTEFPDLAKRLACAIFYPIDECSADLDEWTNGGGPADIKELAEKADMDPELYLYILKTYNFVKEAES